MGRQEGMPLSEADVDNCPDKQAHDLKQQNITSVPVTAEICQAIKGHMDLQGLTDIGPWASR